MRRIILIVIILSRIFGTEAQENELFIGKILNDSNSFKNIPKHQNHLKPLLKSKNQIEIRYIKSHKFSPTEYIVLKFNKKWEVEKVFYDTLKNNYSTVSVTPKLNLDTVFNQLVNNRIFSIKDCDSVDYDEYNTVFRINENDFVGFGGGINDGTVYCIEYKVGDYFRRYKYYNPEYFIKIYKLVPELNDIVEIINIFESLTK
jgi:hypothetical protein